MAAQQRPPVFELHIRPMFRLLEREHMTTLATPGIDLWDLDAVWAKRNLILEHLRAEGLQNMPGVPVGGPWPRRMDHPLRTLGRHRLRCRARTPSRACQAGRPLPGADIQELVAADGDGHRADGRLPGLVRARLRLQRSARLHAASGTRVPQPAGGPHASRGPRHLREGRRDEGRHPRCGRHSRGADPLSCGQLTVPPENTAPSSWTVPPFRPCQDTTASFLRCPAMTPITGCSGCLAGLAAT